MVGAFKKKNIIFRLQLQYRRFSALRKLCVRYLMRRSLIDLCQTLMLTYDNPVVFVKCHGLEEWTGQKYISHICYSLKSVHVLYNILYNNIVRTQLTIQYSHAVTGLCRGWWLANGYGLRNVIGGFIAVFQLIPFSRSRHKTLCIWRGVIGWFPWPAKKLNSRL